LPISYFDDKNKQSIVVIINFGSVVQDVYLRNVTNLSDYVVVETTGGCSNFRQGDLIRVDDRLELKAFESIVGFYNAAAAVVLSKFVLFVLFSVVAAVARM